MSRWILFIMSLGIGVAVPAGYSVLYSVLAHRPLALGEDVNAVNVLIVAAPYLFLSLFGVRTLLPWAAALTLTLSLWIGWLDSTVSYARHPDGSGVDMFTIALVFASPFIISITAFAVDAVQQWASARRP
jgi:hypothetical protein